MTARTSVSSRGHSKITLLLVLVKTIISPFPGDAIDPNYGTYFQYINVPGKNEYNFGFNRGNPDHYISRYEQAKDWNFRTKVQWGDKHGGSGEHYWDYNHFDKGKGKNGNNVYGNNGHLVGEYGSLGETYGSIDGGYISIPSEQGSHLDLGSGHASLAGGFGNGFTSLGNIQGAVSGNYGSLDGNYGTVSSSHNNIGSGFGIIGGNYESLGNSFTHDAAAYKFLSGKLKGENGVLASSYGTPENNVGADLSGLYSKLPSTAADFHNVGGNHNDKDSGGAHITSSTYHASASTNTKVENQHSSGADKQNTQNQENKDNDNSDDNDDDKDDEDEDDDNDNSDNDDDNDTDDEDDDNEEDD